MSVFDTNTIVGHDAKERALIEFVLQDFGEGVGGLLIDNFDIIYSFCGVNSWMIEFSNNNTKESLLLECINPHQKCNYISGIEASWVVWIIRGEETVATSDRSHYVEKLILAFYAWN